ncbi:thiol-activated cytolysin family protein [Nocardiopsis sp. CNT312]|uniref:thiol-activated cytolysin family protein n=1 Tax=Nocardiopsis sp. CNT312 TaxID=1137268 RepID=UPI00048B6941|nr:thiol-activated cytolysin family protein [Nocardiopsis sp. CNT312]
MTDTTETTDVLTHTTAGDGRAELTWPTVPEAEQYEIQPLGSAHDRTVVPAGQNRIEIPHARNGYQITALRGAIPLQSYVSLDRASADEPIDMTEYVSGLQDWTQIAPQFRQSTRAPKGDPVTNEEIEQGRTWVVTTRKYTLSTTPKDVVLASGLNTAIWPGALIQGGPAAQGALSELVISQRKPLTVSTNLTSLAQTRVTGVEPSQSAVREAIATMVRGQPGAAGSIDYTIEEASSIQSGLLEAGISASYLGFKGEVSTELKKKRDEKIILACFLQNAFSVSMDVAKFDEPSEWFTRDLTKRKIQRIAKLGRIGDNNPPLYVSSVGYGRSLIFVLKTTADTTKAKAAVKASYQGFGARVSGELKAEYESILNQSSLKIIAQGGDAAAITNMIREGRLDEYFKEPPRLDQYIPISYSLHSLATNDPAKLGETAEYSVVTRVPKGATSWMLRPVRLSYRGELQGRDVTPSGPLVLRFDGAHPVRGTKREGNVTTFGDDMPWMWTPRILQGDATLGLTVEDTQGSFRDLLSIRVREQQLGKDGEITLRGQGSRQQDMMRRLDHITRPSSASWELTCRLTADV